MSALMGKLRLERARSGCKTHIGGLGNDKTRRKSRLGTEKSIATLRIST